MNLRSGANIATHQQQLPDEHKDRALPISLFQRIPHWEACARDNFSSFPTTILSRMLATWWGIDIGANSRFFGIPCFRRIPGSAIRIGSNCDFRSRSDSNLIGINHKCIISTLSAGAEIKIGSNCGFSGTVIGAELRIEIGNRVRCGANTVITDTDWHSEDPRVGAPAPVVIEDDAWLGLNVTVLKGVRIGAGALIGAGSVVTKDVPAGRTAAGNPARVIGESIDRPL